MQRTYSTSSTCRSVFSLIALSLFLPLLASASVSVSLSPSGISFGSVPVNTTTSAATVSITNNGRSASIVRIDSSIPQFAVLTPSLPLQLRPNSTTSIQVTFSPTADVTYNGVIRIVVRYGQDTYSSRMLPVSGTGAVAPTQPSAPAPAPVAVLSLSTGNLNFASVPVGTASSQSVSLTNTGTGSLTILQATTTGIGFAITGWSGSVTLAAGQSYSLAVSYTPSTTGSSSGTLSVVSDAANSPATATLTGAGVQPQIAILPASLSFPTVTVGAASSQTLVVSNPGNANLNVSQVVSTGSGFTVAGISTPVVIAPGGSHSFTVSLSPTAAGTYSGSLSFLNNSPTPSVAVPLSGTAVSATLQLSASPTALGFGNVTTSSSAKQTVTLTNTGNSSVSLSSYSVSGTGFSASGLTLPMVLSPGQSTSFAVAFAPASTGSVSGSVAVNSNATSSPSTVALTGTGVQAQIAVLPQSIDFGSLTAGVTNTQTVKISNPGTADLTLSQAVLTGSAFTFSGIATPFTIAPGGSYLCTVSFSPAAAGTYSGSLNFTNNSATPSVSVLLAGKAVSTTLQLGASPAALSFGSVTTGSSATQTVTLTNTGNSSVSLSSYNVSGTGFSASGLTVPLVLSPGQATSFQVVFAPAATGSASGNVVVNSNATNSPATVAFSGSGTAPVVHGVALSWTPSSLTYTGFNVYRGSASGGPYARINSSLLPSASFQDSGIVSGQSYYYVATEVDSAGMESAYSNEASAVIP